MLSNLERRISSRQAWVCKCNAKYGYSWLDPEDGFLRPGARRIDEDFEGEEWVKSPLGQQNLGRCKRGDLVFCYQTDLRGIVGLTMAASDGYRDPNGKLPACTTIDLGPGRVRFPSVVTIADIRRRVGQLDAFRHGGTAHSTFLEIESRFLRRLLKVCVEVNPSCGSQINTIVSSVSRPSPSRLDSMVEATARKLLADPIRREITIEAFERKAAWAAEARRVYGSRCMASGCSFTLLKADGTKFIEVHHVISMCEGGGNNIRNLSVLCPNHHRAIHYGLCDTRRKLEREVEREQRDRVRGDR